MSREKDLAKNTAILTFGKICTQCISFFMLPLYTALLNTSDYGVFDLFITYGTLLLPLVNWQFDQGLFRFMLDKRGSREGQSQLFSTVFVSITIQSLLYIVIFAVVNINLNVEHAWFIVLYVVLQGYISVLLQFVRGLGKTVYYALGSFLSASSIVVFNVITLVCFKWGLIGLFFSTTLSQIVTLVFLAISSKSWQYFTIKNVSYCIFKDIRNYSVPLIPNNLAWWVVNASDRLVISHVLGVAANGIFTVASKFSSVFIQLYNIVNLSWTESVSLHINDEDRDAFLSDMMTTIFKLFSCMCFGVIAIMPFLYPVMVNEKYSEGYNQVAILMYAMLFRVLVGLYSCVYIAKKESRKVAVTSIAAAIINLVVDLLLIKKIGIYAASISSLIAFLSMFIIRYWDVNKTVHMRIKNSVAVSSIIAGIIVGISFYSNSGLFQVVILCGIIIYSIVINIDVLRNIVKLFKKFRNQENFEKDR